MAEMYPRLITSVEEPLVLMKLAEIWPRYKQIEGALVLRVVREAGKLYPNTATPSS